MSDFLKNYIETIEKEFEDVRKDIAKQKKVFGLTNWTDAPQMIEAANKISALEDRLRDAKEVHKIILENYGVGFK